MTASLRAALADLVEAGAAAGLPDGVARAEGARLAAAVAEGSMPGAAEAWCAAVDGTAPADFFTQASAGRRWRSAPTDALARLAGGPHAASYAQSLAAVVGAAATIGTPGPHVGPAAARTAAIQLAAASAPAVASTPSASVDQMLARLDQAQTSLTALRPDLPAPEVPSVESILAALGGGAGSTAPAPQSASVQTDAPAAVGEAAAEPAAEPATAAQPEKTLEELLAELDELVGLTRVKSEVRRQVELLRVEKLRVEAGLTRPTLTRHLVFVGNPGTGKTTVARLVSGIYKALGLLSKGHLVEVDRSELVAGYLGQTAIKTAEVASSAVGGVLFIDEAYALTQSSGLAGPDSYGQEAVNTLVKEMEDHRDDLVVIVAGYPLPMAEFVAANPGLESRFSTTITFDDYTDDELREIFALMADGADFSPRPETLRGVTELCAEQPRDTSFGNARFVRNLLDAAIARHAWRLRDVEAPTIDQLRTLLPEDLRDASEDGQDGPTVADEPEHPHEPEEDA